MKNLSKLLTKTHLHAHIHIESVRNEALNCTAVFLVKTTNRIFLKKSLNKHIQIKR